MDDSNGYDLDETFDVTLTRRELITAASAMAAFGAGADDNGRDNQLGLNTLELAILALSLNGIEPDDMVALRDRFGELANPEGFAAFKAAQEDAEKANELARNAQYS